MSLATAERETPPDAFCICYTTGWMEGTNWALQRNEDCTVCPLVFIGTITNLGLESIIMSSTKPRLYKIVYKIPNDLEDSMNRDRVWSAANSPNAKKNGYVNNWKDTPKGRGTRLALYNTAQDQTTKILVKKDDVRDDKQILGLMGKFLQLLSDNEVLESHQQFFDTRLKISQ
eukprot:TRINITY_DN2975_c0_g1_i1.p1 TRINITY_DN2975_c0_g1~~TRINITY_DN2975_c0_g1_i1.p1  ORF type:complete len:200 (-),score=5.82 TRINITY_DN2975_c0_g1_i1:53-571(-)